MKHHNIKLAQKVLAEHKGMKVFRRHTKPKKEIMKLKNNAS